MKPGNGNGGNGLIVRVPLFDAAGNRVGETEAATFKGLLALAHGEGLRAVRTCLIERPSSENGETAIVQAFVQTNRGRFSALGDANPENTDAPFAVHAIRIAETRALARAFRLAVNNHVRCDLSILRRTVSTGDGRKGTLYLSSRTHHEYAHAHVQEGRVPASARLSALPQPVLLSLRRARASVPEGRRRSTRPALQRSDMRPS